MDNKQIAHDLAIARLHNSDLETAKLVEQYRQYYKEIHEYLVSQVKPNAVKVTQNPFR